MSAPTFFMNSLPLLTTTLFAILLAQATPCEATEDAFVFRGVSRSYTDADARFTEGDAPSPEARAGVILSWCQRTILTDETSGISIDEADVERVLAVWMREGIVHAYDPERFRAADRYREAYQAVVDEGAQQDELRIEAIHADASKMVSLEHQVSLQAFRTTAAALPSGASVCCEGELSEEAYFEGIRRDIRTYLMRDAATLLIVEAGAVGKEKELMDALAPHLGHPGRDLLDTLRSDDPVRFLLLERLWTLFQIQEIRAGLSVPDASVASVIIQTLDRSEHHALSFYQSTEVSAFALLRGIVTE